jgi:hypothetical protein
VEPVAPRPEFIHQAKRQLMDLPPTPARPRWMKPSVLAALVLSLLALLGALLYLRDRE